MVDQPRRIVVEVIGLPAPQGSKRAFVVDGKARLVESSQGVKPWRQDVKYAALAALPDGHVPMAGPVLVEVHFFMPRPKTHYRTGAHARILRADAPMLVGKRPDLDKLVRSTLDALGEAGVWGDDCQVCELWAVKRYVALDGTVGARIEVVEASK